MCKYSKPSLLKMVLSSVKEALQAYKVKCLDLKSKKGLLSCRSDWALLEELIQNVNQNPDLRVEVRLSDGTVLLLKTYKPQDRKTASQLINDTIGYYDNHGNFIVE